MTLKIVTKLEQRVNYSVFIFIVLIKLRFELPFIEKSSGGKIN